MVSRRLTVPPMVWGVEGGGVAARSPPRRGRGGKIFLDLIPIPTLYAQLPRSGMHKSILCRIQQRYKIQPHIRQKIQIVSCKNYQQKKLFIEMACQKGIRAVQTTDWHGIKRLYVYKLFYESVRKMHQNIIKRNLWSVLLGSDGVLIKARNGRNSAKLRLTMSKTCKMKID